MDLLRAELNQKRSPMLENEEHLCQPLTQMARAPDSPQQSGPAAAASRTGSNRARCTGLAGIHARAKSPERAQYATAALNAEIEDGSFGILPGHCGCTYRWDAATNASHPTNAACFSS